MEIRELKTFLEIASLGSFQLAAQKLHYAQSSVTAQIKSLEDKLGKRLFIRNRKQIILTEEGKKLQVYAQKILDLSQEAAESVRNTPSLSGHLSIGAAETIAAYRLPPLLKAFQDSAPLVHISFKPMSDKAIYRSLQNGTLDIGFLIEKEVPSAKAQSLRICDEDVSVYMAPDKARYLAGKPLKFIAAERFLLWQEVCSYRAAFEELMMSRGAPLTDIMEFVNIETLKQCAVAGIGIGLLCDISVTNEIGTGQLVKSSHELDLDMSSYLLWNKDRQDLPTINSFIDSARTFFKIR